MMLKRLSTLLNKSLTRWAYKSLKEFIHFGLTSQDINNTAIPYTFKLALNEVYYPAIDESGYPAKKIRWRLGKCTYA
jgi:adenylosuccinate lyase